MTTGVNFLALNKFKEFRRQKKGNFEINMNKQTSAWASLIILAYSRSDPWARYKADLTK